MATDDSLNIWSEASRLLHFLGRRFYLHNLIAISTCAQIPFYLHIKRSPLEHLIIKSCDEIIQSFVKFLEAYFILHIYRTP